MASNEKVSFQAMFSAAGSSFCGSQTCFFVLVLALGLDVNVNERKQGFSHSLLDSLPGLDVPARVGCAGSAKGSLRSGCRANQG